VSIFHKNASISDEERINTIIIEANEIRKQIKNKKIRELDKIMDSDIISRYAVSKPSTAAGCKGLLRNKSKPIGKDTGTENLAVKRNITMQDIKEELPELDGTAKEVKKTHGLSWWDSRKLKNKPDQSYIISMDFSNGTTRTFVIATRSEIFKYHGRTYYLRYEDCKFDLSSNQYKLCYHEDYALPYSREVKQIEVEYKDPNNPTMREKWAKALRMVNPSNFMPLLEGEYIRILAENLLSKYIKLCLLVSILSFIVSLIAVIGIVKLGAFKGR
jgi:hypothetical protein